MFFGGRVRNFLIIFNLRIIDFFATGLRKLTLVLGNNNFKSLTDYVLFRVIRYMKLQELRLISRQPIKSVRMF